MSTNLSTSQELVNMTTASRLQKPVRTVKVIQEILVGHRGCINRNYPSLTVFCLAVTEKSEGRPSLWHYTEGDQL